MIGRRPPEIVHRPKTTTDMVGIVHRLLPPRLDVSSTYARLELAHQLPLQALFAPLSKGGTSLWGQEVEMKKLMMVMVIGLALATPGFAQGRGGSRPGGGHSFGGSSGHSYSGRGFGGQFSGQTSRGRFEGGFSGYRSGYGRSSFGFGFSYAPSPYGSGYYEYPYPDPYYYPYASYGPPYYPGPVVGVGVFGGGLGRGRSFVGRGGDWHRFGRR